MRLYRRVEKHGEETQSYLEEQDMTTTDRIMESLMVLESKSDSRFLAIHGEDEPQVRAAIDKVLAERGALKLLNILRDDFIGLSEYWNGGDGNAAVNAAQYSRSVANNAISEIDSFLAHRSTPAPAAPTVSPEQERMVSITTALKAIRCESAGKNDIAYLDEFLEGVRARLTAPPVKPTKQEIVVAVLGQYDFQTQDLGIEELANEIVVRLDAADKEKCDAQARANQAN